MKVFFLAHGNSRHYLKPGTIANNMYVQQPGVLMGKSFYLRTISGHGGQRSASRAWHSFLITKPSKQAAVHTLGRYAQCRADSFGASNTGTFACRTFQRDTQASKRA